MTEAPQYFDAQAYRDDPKRPVPTELGNWRLTKSTIKIAETARQDYIFDLWKGADWKVYLTWLGHCVEHMAAKTWISDKDVRDLITLSRSLEYQRQAACRKAS